MDCYSLQPGQVQVWRLAPVYSAELVQCCLPLLVPAEVLRAQQFRFPQDSWRFVVARAHLRLLLARYLAVLPHQVRLAYGAYGKPYLTAEASWLHFNLSHAAGLLVYGLAYECAVGVDVEAVVAEPNWLALAQRVLNQAQVQHLQALPPKQGELEFYQAWSANEALLKAVGCGFSREACVALPTLAVGMRGVVLSPDLAGQPQVWSVWPLAVGTAYRAAVAAQGASLTLLALRDWDTALVP